MHWLISSIIMFISSVIMYLLLRQSDRMGNSKAWNNQAFFLLPALFFTVTTFLQQSFIIPNVFIAVLFLISAFVFQFGSSMASLQSIKLAPNPGYSLVISKSYGILTIFLSAFLFDSEITTLKIVAVMLVIVFAALITLEKSSLKTHSSRWFLLSLIPFFGWSFDSMISKYLYTQGVPINYRLMVGCWLVACIGILTQRNQLRITPSLKQGKILIAMGFATIIFYYFRQAAIESAPNVGYVNAISTGSIALLTIMSSLLFKDEFNLKKFIGVFGISVGLVLLII